MTYVLGVLLFLFAPTVNAESELHSRLAQAVRRLPLTSAVSIVDSESGAALFQHNAKTPLKPASVMKLVTSAAALELLGPSYRFATEVYEYPVKGGYGLAIVGGGDPSLTIERAFLLAREIRLVGRGQYEELVLDDSAFVQPPKRQGQRAYQTGASALSFNFNSITISICPTSAGRAATLTVDPWESGWQVEGKVMTGGKNTFVVDELRAGRYRAQGSIGGRDCSKVYRSVQDPVAYFGDVFPKLLRSAGVSVENRVRVGRLPERARKIYQLRSEPLTQIVGDLNHFSNNFIGEQILYLLGGPLPFDRERGIEQLSSYLRRVGVPLEEALVMDGSGLSHQNQLSARALTTLLSRTRDQMDIYPEFEVSLSVAGRSGTLRDRDFGVPNGAIRAKTGTLDGVTSLAGYVRAKSGRKVAFAIILNGVRDRPTGHELERDLVKILYLHA